MVAYKLLQTLHRLNVVNNFQVSSYGNANPYGVPGYHYVGYQNGFTYFIRFE
jgi:hypothetical protein